MAQEQSRPLTEKQLNLLAKNKPSNYFKNIEVLLQNFESVIQGFSKEVMAINFTQLKEISRDDLIGFKEMEISHEVFIDRHLWLSLLNAAIDSDSWTSYYKNREQLFLRLKKLQELQKWVERFITIREMSATDEREVIAKLYHRIVEEAKEREVVHKLYQRIVEEAKITPPEKFDNKNIEPEISSFILNIKQFFKGFIRLENDLLFKLYYRIVEETKEKGVNAKLFHRILDETKTKPSEKLNSRNIESEISGFAFDIKQFFREFINLGNAQLLFLDGLETASHGFLLQVKEKLEQKQKIIRLYVFSFSEGQEQSKKIIWKGQLSDENTILNFEENFSENSEIDSFILLQITPETFAKILATSSKEEYESLFEEVLNAFITYYRTTGAKGLFPPEDQSLSVLLQDYHSVKNASDVLWQKICMALPSTINPRSSSAVIAWLRQHQKDNEFQAVQEKFSLVKSAHEALKIYYHNNPSIFQYYVNALEVSKLKPGLQSFILYAKKEGISIYIWENKNEETNDNNNINDRLQLKNFYKAEKKSQAVHLLYHDGLDNFSLLSPYVSKNNFSNSQSEFSEEENQELKNFKVSRKAIEDQLNVLHHLPQTQLFFFEQQMNKLLMLGECRPRYNGEETIRQRISDKTKKQIKFLIEFDKFPEAKREALCQFKQFNTAQQNAIIKRLDLPLHQQQYIERLCSLGIYDEMTARMKPLQEHLFQIKAKGIYDDSELPLALESFCKIFSSMKAFEQNRSFYHELREIILKLPTQSSGSPRYSRYVTQLYRDVEEIFDTYVEKDKKIHVTQKNKFFSEAYMLQLDFVKESLKNAITSQGFQDQTLIGDITFLVGIGRIRQLDQMGEMIHITYIDRLIINNYCAQQKIVTVNSWANSDYQALEVLLNQGDQWLLDHARLQTEAKHALLQGETDWFEILVGVPYVEEKKKMETQQSSNFIKKRSLLFKDKVLKKQISLLEQYKHKHLGSSDNLAQLQNGFRILLQKEEDAEGNLLEEYLTKPHQNVYWGSQLIEVTSTNQQNIVEKFKSQYMDSVIDDCNLHLYEDTNIPNLITLVENRLASVTLEITKMDEKQDRVEKRIQGLREQHQDLAKKLKAMHKDNKLPPSYMQSFDKIETAMLECPIDIDHQYEGKNTLLHIAFQTQNERAAQILLEKNANILAENDEGVTVFAMCLEDLSNPAMRAMNDHVRQPIEKIVPKSFPGRYSPEELYEHVEAEVKLLNEPWDHISNYFTNQLQNNIGFSFLKKIWTGVILNLGERKAQCEIFYKQLCEATTYKDLKRILLAMRKQAEEAGKGIRRKSDLNDKLIILIDKVLAHLEQCEDYNERVRNLEMSKRATQVPDETMHDKEKEQHRNEVSQVNQVMHEAVSKDLEIEKLKVQEKEVEIKTHQDRIVVLESSISQRDTELTSAKSSVQEKDKIIEEKDKRIRELMAKLEMNEKNKNNQSNNDEEETDNNSFRRSGPGMFGSHS